MENSPLEQLSPLRKDIPPNSDAAMTRLRELEVAFSTLANDNSITESEFYSRRFPIDGEVGRILDEYPDLRTWYENEL